MSTNGLNCLKKVEISIWDEGDTMANRPEMVDSVNALILTDKRVTMEDIPEQLEISKDTTHKIMYDDLDFSQFSYWCVYQDNARPHCTTSGNQQLCRLRTAATFSFQSRFDPLWISSCLANSKNFCVEQSFQTIIKWKAKGEEPCPKISMLKEYKSFVYRWVKSFKERR